MALPPGVTSADRRDDVVRLLADAPEGLSDGELARALGDGVRPQTVNTLCRRMAADGVVERAGTRPIRTRLVPGTAPAPEDPVPGSDTPSDHGVSLPKNGSPPDALASDDAVVAEPVVDHAPHAEPVVAEPVVAEPPPAETVDAEPRPEPVRPASSEDRGVRPVRDVAQAWSRTVNVQAAVATWLAGRGATIRSATLDGSAPARDLVARLDGDDLHVEITGWPPDGARTHPTTIAADWFSAAARAAVTRRGAAPHARIVIALPDTRRYRALAAVGGPDLATARTEVWFVDPTGAVEQTAPATANGARGGSR